MSKGAKTAAKEALTQATYNQMKTANMHRAPRRPLSAYTFYFIATRDSTVKKFPDLAPTEIMRKIAQSWKNTTDEERSVYYEHYDQDSERYNRQMTEFEADGKFYDDEGNEVKYVNLVRAKKFAQTQSGVKRMPPVKQEGDKRKGYGSRK
jgi:hypothetical protein